MEKGISFYFGFDIRPKLRAKMIKEAGFDCVITNADKRFNRQNGSIAKQVKLFRKNGLKLSSLHMSYKSEELHYFWEEGKFGEKLKKNLIKDIKTAHKYGFRCVVVHVDGKYSKIGEKRLLEILDICDKLNVPIAIENLNKNRILLFDIFKNIKSNMLKFCYDSGHNNAFDKDFDYLSKLSGELYTLHLHDNDGKADLHTISKICATVDWDYIAKELVKNKEIPLDYELLNKKENSLTAGEFLQEAFIQANLFEYKLCDVKI